jgi:hypothetical protein
LRSTSYTARLGDWRRALPQTCAERGHQLSCGARAASSGSTLPGNRKARFLAAPPSGPARSPTRHRSSQHTRPVRGVG